MLRRGFSLRFFIFFFVLIGCLTIFPFQEANANSRLRSIYQNGQEAYRSRDIKEAIKQFKRAIRIDPEFAPAYNALGLCHRAIGTDVADVIWLYQTAIELDPQYTKAYENLSRLTYNMGEFDQAEKFSLRAIKLNPLSSRTQTLLGWIYLLGKGLPTEASHYFEIIAKKRPSADVHYGLGLSYYFSGKNSYIFDQILALREFGQDTWANKLETMIREGTYLSPGSTGVLIDPEMVKFVLSEDMNASFIPQLWTGRPLSRNRVPVNNDLLVRLRGKLSDVVKIRSDGRYFGSDSPIARIRAKREKAKEQK